VSAFAGRRPRAPRLFAKILGASFAVIAAVLVAVWVPLTWQARERLVGATVAHLEASQQRFVTQEARRQREQYLRAQAVAENPTLKAAMDTYQSERGHAGLARNTLHGELAKLQRLMDVAALAVTDSHGVILASAGPRSRDWQVKTPVVVRDPNAVDPVDAVVVRGAQTYLATVVASRMKNDVIGWFFLASPLDDDYARRLSRDLSADTRTEVAVVIDGRVVAGSLTPELRAGVQRAGLPENGSVTIDDEEFVVRRLIGVDMAAVYALTSKSAAIYAATSSVAWVLVAIGIGALVLAAIASWWLATTLASPIRDLTRTLADMAAQRAFDRPVPASGVSQELDALAETFDALRSAVRLAEAESEATYLGVIGALAAVLDARDPYTAGHSERVATLSVAIGRKMQLPDADIETLRLGALLHDIGKIGVSDSVLRKPGRLTPDEFEQIKRHPLLDARILKPLRFLSGHLAIVELHHEQPDGRGYPHGLRADQIPLLASVVRVADAFDAITTARAYRPARSATEAMAELWSHAGSAFDTHVVQALAAIPEVLLVPPPVARPDSGAAPDLALPGALVPFRAKVVVARESAG
jgi:HD-GYP domain-containing protein (c-di-GMP phosphodiesterase class II)